MKLTATGETQLIDFSEIVRWTAKTIKRTMPDRYIDEDKVEKCVGAILDNTLTMNMKWTKVTRQPPEEHYLAMMDIPDYPSGWLFIQDIIDHITGLLENIIDLPTWRIVSMRIMGSFARIELDEDFRVKDWMEHHAKEYRLRDEVRRW